MSEASSGRRAGTRLYARVDDWVHWQLWQSASPALTDARMLWPTDAPRALAETKALAEAGSAGAMIDMGRVLWHGLREEPDKVAALDWLRRAAATGDAMALYLLGRYCLADGLRDEGLRAFEASAAKGFIPGQIYAGSMHAFWGGHDLKKGIAFFEAARRAGSPAGKTLLGGLLFRRRRNPFVRLRGLALVLSGVGAMVWSEVRTSESTGPSASTRPLASEAVPVAEFILFLALIGVFGAVWLWREKVLDIAFWSILALVIAALVAAPFLIARRRARAMKERRSHWPLLPVSVAPPSPGN